MVELVEQLWNQAELWLLRLAFPWQHVVMFIALLPVVAVFSVMVSAVADRMMVMRHKFRLVSNDVDDDPSVLMNSQAPSGEGKSRP